MAEDWDLYAVVRSCKSANTTSSSAAAPATAPAVTMDPMNGVKTTPSSEDTLSCLAALRFEEENDPFSFPDLVVEPRTDAFQELQEFYKPFFPSNPTTTTFTTTSTSNHAIIPNSSISHFGGSSGQHPVVQYDVVPPQQHQHLRPGNDAVRPQVSPQSYISGFRPGPGFLERQQLHEQEHSKNQLHQKRQQELGVQQGFPKPDAASVTLPLSPLALTTVPISQSPRSRKRKNQQKKMVCHVSAENLSSDLWAWRKYGQKPIKGSPYPRNYYRCSSSKGCAARKQVERSNSDPNSFVVTYTGDHTHPRPTHRNSLAGSTRNKLTPTPTTTTMNKNKDLSDQSSQAAMAVNPASCSSPQSATSLSPTTPLTVVQTEEEIAAKQQEEKLDGGDINKRSKEMLMEDEMDENEDNEDNDDDIDLIPNISLSEDFFLGLKELGCSPSGAGAAC